MISAEVIADSIAEQSPRLTAFRLRYPKFIHGEFMTHRVISRNASSSRAVPTAKLIEEVRSERRAGPVFWGKNQKGMQAAEELTGEDKAVAQHMWRMAAQRAAEYAEELVRLGVHKQIVNRLLEPFSHINVVASATEWENFFGLRLHADAQPEMRALAKAMWQARQASKPKVLKPGEWHLPFVAEEDWVSLYTTGPARDSQELTNSAIAISVARCARVSYESFETGRRSTIEEDLALYARLLSAQPLHASPAEHQATPDEWASDEEALRSYGEDDFTKRIGWQKPAEHGNFVGWRQYRKMLSGEACAPLPDEYLPF